MSKREPPWLTNAGKHLANHELAAMMSRLPRINHRQNMNGLTSMMANLKPFFPLYKRPWMTTNYDRFFKNANSQLRKHSNRNSRKRQSKAPTTNTSKIKRLK